MQKSKKLQKLHAKIEKVAKSCMQKSKKLQKVAIYNSWKKLKTLNYIYLGYLGNCWKL